MSDDDSRQYEEYTPEASRRFLTELILADEPLGRLPSLHRKHFGTTVGQGTIAMLSRELLGVRAERGISEEQREYLRIAAAEKRKFSWVYRSYVEKFGPANYSALIYHWKNAKKEVESAKSARPIAIHADGISLTPGEDGTIVLPSDMFEANSLEEDRTEALRDSMYSRMLSLGIRRFQIWDDGRCEAEFVKNVKIGAKTYE